ncbi:hypothetical protein [Arcicella aurantiaca]|nr:hypothetical protein [Arcicella aurantiaca]
MNPKNNYIAFTFCMIVYLFGGTVSTLMSASLPVAVPELLGGNVSYKS